jgi:hypothetical protein
VIFIDPGLVAGSLGISSGLFCLLVLRKQRSASALAHAEMGSEIQSRLLEQKADYSEQIARLSRELDALELGVQNTGQAGRSALTLAIRSQAVQLIQSGMSPETVAQALGIGKREIRLMANVSRTLSLP